jgi:peroxiredoxin
MKPAQLAQGAQLLFIALAAFVVHSFVSAAQDGEARAACTPLCAIRPAYANRNRTAPDLDLPDLDGKRVRLSSFKGKVVVLNFWTKTCRPCLEEMPALGDLHELLKNEGAVLLTVSTDESADDARATLRAVLGKDPPFPVLIDPDASWVSGRFGTRLYPETWFIDPKGVIRARIDGARDWTNPMVLDVVRMISRPSGCELTFDRGKPRGDRRGICSETVGVAGE